MKQDNKLLNQIAHKINMLNTIDGGVSMTTVRIINKEDPLIIAVKTPGLSKFSYHVELIHKMLLIYTLVEFDKNETLIYVPSFIKYIPIPQNINTDEIYAVYENGELKVIAPYSEQKNFRQRIVKIEYLA